MRYGQLCVLVIGSLVAVPTVFGADIKRTMAAEIDPLSPMAANIQSKEGDSITMWGAMADFNLGELATGPEYWMGNFNRKGVSDEEIRREDLQPGEFHKIEASRLRWTLSWFEKPSSIRGWFVKAGYSYTKINSRAKRDLDNSYLTPDPVAVESNIQDIRHGVVAGFGQRWALWDQSFTISLAVSATHNFRRTVTTDSDDPAAKEDYETMIESIPNTHMSPKPVPEANLNFGYLM
jgi:hypothetical protein